MKATVHRSGKAAIMHRASSGFFALTGLLAALSGCEVSCERTCEKLLSCDAVETPGVSLPDCETACLSQEVLYDGWEDEAKLDALSDYKSCVNESSCEAIAEGVCYDEDIYSW